MASQLRIGFVGTGGIAGAHMRRLQEIPEARITALCDIDEARVKAAAEPFKAEVFTDAKKLIDSKACDALYICVPPFAHGDIEIRAAEAGLHLFVEKPVNLYIPEGLKAWQAIKKAGVKTQAGYTLRYFAGSIQLKQFLADKEVGAAHVFRWGGLPGSPWWRKYDKAGGQLVEMTTHQVDLLRWVMGEVEWVSAAYSTGRLFKDDASVTVPDSQSVLLRFTSGATATVSTACCAAKGGMGRVDFIIKDARVEWTGDKTTVIPEDGYDRPVPPAEVPSIDAAFVRGILNDQPALLRSPFDDALISAAVTIAANQSAENNGQPVRIADLVGELLK